jgi:hypothetical protein
MGDHPDSQHANVLLFLLRGATRDRKQNMPDVYFHWSDADHDLIDSRGAAVDDFSDARVHADRFVRSLITAPNTEDWRGWVLRVTDEFGDEMFAVPFASALGKPH